MSQVIIEDQLVERIIKSRSFGTSVTYANLLKFLVASTRSGNIPKETTIGSYLFGSNTAEEYDTAKVRVYIFNLRKKLKNYFEGEGDSEALTISIPKGSYKIDFSRRAEKRAEKKSNTKKLMVIIALSLAASILLNIDLWVQKKNLISSYEVLPESAFWSDFINGDQPILLVLGDLLVFSENDTRTSYTRTVRVPDFNTVEEIERYKNELNDSSIHIEVQSYTYLIKNSSAWIESLTKIFFSKHKSFQTRVMSRIDVKDLHDNNIIFVGMQKTAGMLNNYFQNSDFSLVHDDTIAYTNENLNTRKLFYPSGNPDKFHTDYGLVVKYPGPNNNTIFMFGGIWDTATSQCLKNFIDPESIQQLEDLMLDKYGSIPEYFEILYKVSGIDRTELDTEVIFVNDLETTHGLWVSEY